MITRRPTPLSFLIFFSVCSVCSVVPSSAEQRPNIIIIYTDDQGYGDASCLNPDSRFQTPNLDRLAREGLTFIDGHCSDTVCTRSSRPIPSITSRAMVR